MDNFVGEYAAQALAKIKSGVQVFGLREIIDRWHPQRKLFVFTVATTAPDHQIILLFQMNRAIMEIGEPEHYPYTGTPILYQTLFPNHPSTLSV